MEVIFFYKNGKTEVVQDVSNIEDLGGVIVTITRKDNYSKTSYRVNILKDLIHKIKIRYFE